MKKRKSITVTNVTVSEARSSKRGKNAIDGGEQRKSQSKGKRGYLDAEREIEQVGNHVLPSLPTWESLMLPCDDDQLYPDPGVRVSPG